ncbi:HIT family protein [Methylococcaceae bacterium CS1]|nr:HIT domain-containing protein [Methyloprofundus sp.]TXK96538.1 HIT family protein [Methylococcaceae bacterium CS4]TXK98938.1 HIT family protein [Methylococcaceae bacterium CS5]TXL06837.1 HIT family protein [Methylococcaceae bacterium CS3]TXL07571.1 HIT family protein [Methylococcaceae bacterium CS1]TXL11411.1 HIT family protein [Methylococcaceae bacterium CS2]
MSFTLHPTLKKDCIKLGHLELCQVLLMNDSQFPWLILVPERDNITEIHQLPPKDQQQLIYESSYIAEQLANLFHADKMNIAALGSMVPQLHIHHVVRYKTDKVWPAPIWGKLEAIAYTDQELDTTQKKLKTLLLN